jgi:hypothetical protein
MKESTVLHAVASALLSLALILTAGCGSGKRFIRKQLSHYFSSAT